MDWNGWYFMASTIGNEWVLKYQQPDVNGNLVNYCIKLTKAFDWSYIKDPGKRKLFVIDSRVAGAGRGDGSRATKQ